MEFESQCIQNILLESSTGCEVNKLVQGCESSYAEVNILTWNANVTVNVHVYGPDIHMSSVDCTIYTPDTGTHSSTVLYPLGIIQHLRTLLQK